MASEERHVTQRANYLARATDPRNKEAEAVAWTERGYSWSAIARKMGTGESTAQGWIERAMAQYGLEIAETLSPDGLEPPLSEPAYDSVGPEYADELVYEDQRTWAEYVDRHQDRLPQEWVHPVLEELQAQGLISVGD